VDERIARGYAKQLISWFDDDITEAHKLSRKAIKEGRKLFQSTQSFEKLAVKFRNIYKNFFINYFFCRTKKNAWLAYTSFKPTEIEYKGHIEKGITADVLYLQFLGDEGLDVKPGWFLIGEHAIARTFERSNLINENVKYSANLILTEFSLVPFWTNFWILFRAFIKKSNIEFSPVIPTNNGLFYCEFEGITESVSKLHLRTYVGKKELSESQDNLRRLLLKASEDLKNSTLSFFPHRTIGNNKNIDMYDYEILIYRIRDILPLLAQEVFKSKDEVEISIFRNNAIQAINEFVNIDIDIIKSLNLQLQKQGYESYFLNLQKS
jgi:hypothetical protein